MLVFMLMPISINAAPNVAARSDDTTRSMSQQELNALFGRIHERAGKAAGMRADFVQRRRMKAFVDDLTSTGTFYFSPPAKFRWEVREPYRSLLLMNGDKVGRFEMADRGMRPADLGDRDAVREMLRPMTAMMRGDFAGAEKQFAVSGESAPALFLIRLEPRNPKMREFIKRITIAIDREKLYATGIQIHEPGGDTIEITFFNQSEAPLNAKLFDVDSPLIEQK